MSDKINGHDISNGWVDEAQLMDGYHIVENHAQAVARNLLASAFVFEEEAGDEDDSEDDSGVEVINILSGDGAVVQTIEIPQVTNGVPVAQGWWCEVCEYLEDYEDVHSSRGSCTGCGCPVDDHCKVAVFRVPA